MRHSSEFQEVQPQVFVMSPVSGALVVGHLGNSGGLYVSALPRAG